MNNPVEPIACKILSVTHETAQEWTFRVESNAHPAPGQFMQLSIPKIGEAPIFVSDAGDNWVEFTIRAVGHVTDCIFSKQPGDLLFLRGPYGHGWPIDKLAGKHLVIISGGTGLAPVRMLLNLLYSGKVPSKSVTLISGFKNVEGILFRPELEMWKKQFNTCYCLDTEEAPGWKKGFVTEYLNTAPFDTFGNDYAVIVVGPPPMMKFVGLDLLKMGVPQGHIWMSFERKMSCAVGKCGHCRIDEVYVCIDGPAFNYTKARLLLD